MKQPLEIERKFLIRMPDREALMPLCSHVYTIEQTYLTAQDGITARVRRRSEQGRTTCFYTEKEFRTARTCVEREREIDQQAYDELLKRRDPAGHTLHKVRWCLPCDGLVFEIDIYPFWQSIAVMEVELTEEEQAFRMPEQLEVLLEVSGDRRLKNAALSREIPSEEQLWREIRAAASQDNEVER